MFALGTVLQLKAGTDTRASATNSGLLVRMARRPLWLAGIASDAVGFIAQAAALRFGQLAVVQPLLVLSVVFALPLGARLGNQRVGRSEASLSQWVIAGIACAAACAPLSLLGRRGSAARRAAFLGAAAGILFGLTAALTKSVVDELHLGVVHVIASWEPYALAGVGYVSMTFNQLALNTGALAATIASSTALDPIVSVALGLTLFDEHLHASSLQAAGAFAALAAALVGVTVLARAEVPSTIAVS